ncbi:hypothetical protein QQP08_004625 [Theobroma cacao]|nr:hypothetical protein QQP08_004625 [Theobroma cacao]
MSSSLSSSAATSSPATNQSDSNSPQNLRTISSAHFPQTSPPPSSFRTTSHSSPNCSLVSPNPTPTDYIFEANQTLTGHKHQQFRITINVFVFLLKLQADTFALPDKIIKLKF